MSVCSCKSGGVRYNAVCVTNTSRSLAGEPGKGPHAMQRIPPSQRVRQRINQLMNDGVNGEADVTTDNICKARIINHRSVAGQEFQLPHHERVCVRHAQLRRGWHELE